MAPRKGSLSQEAAKSEPTAPLETRLERTGARCPGKGPPAPQLLLPLHRRGSKGSHDTSKVTAKRAESGCALAFNSMNGGRQPDHSSEAPHPDPSGNLLSGLSTQMRLSTPFRAQGPPVPELPS